MSELKPRHTPKLSPRDLVSIYTMRVRRNEIHIGDSAGLTPDKEENSLRMDEIAEEIVAKLAAHEGLVEALEAVKRYIHNASQAFGPLDTSKLSIMQKIETALAQAKGGGINGYIFDRAAQ
jgi:hypothetical protein